MSPSLPATGTGVANVSIQNVLITNADRGDYNDLFGVTNGGEAIAIAGETFNNGLLDVEGSRINGAVGGAIYLAGRGTSVRLLSVENTTVENGVGLCTFS